MITNVITGTIVAYGGTEDSLKHLEANGWLLCDGALYDRTANNNKYKSLFDAIGTTWGGDGGNKFAVPDLRGQFLRGVADTSKLDPDKDTRTPSRPDLPAQGNKGNIVGSKQTDSLKDHSHNYAVGSWQHNGDNGTNISYVGTDKQQSWTTGGINDTLKSETRPVNTYVYYIIKY